MPTPPTIETLKQSRHEIHTYTTKEKAPPLPGYGVGTFVLVVPPPVPPAAKICSVRQDAVVVYAVASTNLPAPVPAASEVASARERPRDPSQSSSATTPASTAASSNRCNISPAAAKRS